MDPVKELLSTTGNEHGMPASHHSPTVRATTARTKIVFVYSDEEADEEGRPQGGTRTVDCSDDAVPVSVECLAELQEEATRAEDDGDTGDLVFREDTTADLPTGLSGNDMALLEAIKKEKGSRMHARVVTAPSILDGALLPGAAADEDDLRPLRHHLTPDELRGALDRPGYKRFRVDDEDDDTDKPSAHDASGEVVAEVVETLGTRLKPVVSEDGAVRAVETVVGGYRLTVDESELLEDPQIVAGDGAAITTTACDEADPDAVEPDDANLGDDFGDMDLDFDGFDDEEEGEEEEELDDAIIVAVAAQLLQCCEAEDLDPAMDREAARFASVVKPLLARLRAYEAAHPEIPVISDDDDDENDGEDGGGDGGDDVPATDNTQEIVATTLAPSSTVADGEPASDEAEHVPNKDAEDDEGPLSPAAFAQRVDYHIRRFQRVFRSVYRPRDEPIIIDGVRMDM